MFKAEEDKTEEIKKKDVMVKKDTQVIGKAEQEKPSLPVNYKVKPKLQKCKVVPI